MSVKFEACGFALPTLNFAFCKQMSVTHIQVKQHSGHPGMHTLKSFAFSFFFLLLDPILT